VAALAGHICCHIPVIAPVKRWNTEKNKLYSTRSAFLQGQLNQLFALQNRDSCGKINLQAKFDIFFDAQLTEAFAVGCFAEVLADIVPAESGTGRWRRWTGSSKV
jgi:hypothetical protein